MTCYSMGYGWRVTCHGFIGLSVGVWAKGLLMMSFKNIGTRSVQLGISHKHP